MTMVTAYHFGKIQQAFEEFHLANPKVYETLVRLAEQAKSHGRQRIGIGLLWEVMRWEMMLTTSGDDFKLNNNFRSRYVRRIQVNRPDLADMFQTRELRS